MAGGALARGFRRRPGAGAGDRDVSCAAKARVVASDETEQGARALLNLGHTFGHALEALAHYDAAGWCMAKASPSASPARSASRRALGLCSGQDVGRVEQHLKAVGLPTRIQDIAGLSADARRDAGGDAAGQEGRARPADVHPRARHRREFCREGRERRADALRFLEAEFSGA